MEHLDGVSLADAGNLIAERSLDCETLARSLLRWLMAQVVLDGVFHGDPHPGNILVLHDGRLGVLDFGSVGRLDPATQSGLHQLLFALDRNDSAAARDALVDVLAPNGDVDERQLERSLGQFMVQHLGPASSPNAAMFNSLFRLVSDHGLAVPPEVAAVFRSMATLEGTLLQLAPEFPILDEAKGSAKSLVGEQLDPGSLRDTATNELTALLPVLRPLPRRVARLTTALERGDLSVRMRLFADERDQRFLRSLVGQVSLVFLGATTGIMSVLLLGASGGPEITSTVTLFDTLGYNLLLISTVLVLRAVIPSFHRHD
ncbi:MAG TPA: AarF/UbiB family protein [Acidimicrobiales bacterium]|nr:AarF/UbiB family protein [Acidimicrobiales bacterium]